MDTQLPLRDIHLPEPIGWWPPALGWWLLLILIPTLIIASWWLYKRITRRTAVKTARKLLRQIRRDTQSDDIDKLRQLSALLRRVAISVAPRRDCAGLTGEDWLRYLDRSVKGSPFSEGVGRCLVNAHYRKTVDEAIDMSAMLELCEQWLKGQKQ